MKRVAAIHAELCPQDHPCPAVRVCPVGALTQDKQEAPTIHTDICIGCGRCVMTCPKKALYMVQKEA